MNYFFLWGIKTELHLGMSQIAHVQMYFLMKSTQRIVLDLLGL